MFSVSKSANFDLVGIDFGTTNSVVAYYNKELNQIEFINFDGQEMFSTIIKHGKLQLKGVKRIISNPSEIDTCGFESKTENGLQYLLLEGEWVSLIELCAKLFTYIRRNTNQQLKRNISNCVITVPARFDEYQKQIIIQAATKAGWRVVRVIAEPTAGFIGQEEEADGIYGIYDLGGGTFDFSLIRKQGEVLQVLSTIGDTSIGMDYIDRALADDINDCEKVQSMREAGEIDLSICDEMIDNTISKAKELIELGHKPDKIYMIGGGSMNPYIVDKVKALAEEVVLGKMPQHCVASGAALYGSWLTDNNVYLLIDVVPLSLGIESLHGMVEWIIPRNHPLPVAKQITFTNVDENQTHIVFNVVQGEGVFAKDCRSIGQFKIEIQRQRAHTAKIELTFILDVNGLLSISCKDLDTMEDRRISFDSGAGLTQEMIKKIINHTSENLLDNEKQRQFYKQCEEIDLILHNFPEEVELLEKRKKLEHLDEAKELLAEIEMKLGEKIQEDLESATQIMFSSMLK